MNRVRQKKKNHGGYHNFNCVSRLEDPSLRNRHSVRYSFRQVDVSLSFVIA